MMNEVRRAVIMAAGQGVRLRPVTNDIPKPLIPVHGTRMIDTIIDGLHLQGIREIAVVVGYRREKFLDLKEKYPDLILVDNPRWDTCNNIASLYYAQEHIDDAIIVAGDQIIRNPAVLERSFEKSGYNAVWSPEGAEHEWLLSQENGRIVSCSRTGGNFPSWVLYSISRWSAEDAQKLRNCLQKTYVEEHRDQLYWDDLALNVWPELFDLCVHPMNKEDVLEIDSFEELLAEDNTYSIN